MSANFVLIISVSVLNYKKMPLIIHSRNLAKSYILRFCVLLFYRMRSRTNLIAGLFGLFASAAAFFPPSLFSHPRFILHPHFLIRVLTSIRIFSSAFYPPSALPIHIFSSAIRIRVLSIPSLLYMHALLNRTAKQLL